MPEHLGEAALYDPMDGGHGKRGKGEGGKQGAMGPGKGEGKGGESEKGV